MRVWWWVEGGKHFLCRSPVDGATLLVLDVPPTVSDLHMVMAAHLEITRRREHMKAQRRDRERERLRRRTETLKRKTPEELRQLAADALTPKLGASAEAPRRRGSPFVSGGLPTLGKRRR